MSSFCFVNAYWLLDNRTKKREKTNRKKVEKVMIEYLQKNYNINKVENVNAEYSLSGYVASSEFEGIVTGNFTKEGQEYQILCEYDEEKCYDSLSYMRKVHPILTNHIKSILDNYLIHNIPKPDSVTIKLNTIYLHSYLDKNTYGLFNNYDNVKTYEDIINYYNFEWINIIYNSSNKIIQNNTSAFERLAQEMKTLTEVTVFD